MSRVLRATAIEQGQAEAGRYLRRSFDSSVSPDVTLTWSSFEAPDTLVRAARLMKAHGVEFNVLAAVHADNVAHPLDFYSFLRDEVGTRFIEFIPVVDDLAAGRNFPAEEWGSFLTEIFDEWVRCDFGRVFIQLFDIALTQRGDYPPGYFLAVSDRETGLNVLDAGYRKFFAHVQRGRITACSESAVKRFAV